jgi:tetratricopeptide (TPR) repeat protein
MDHVEPLIARLVLGHLPEEARTLVVHLLDCSDCRGEVLHRIERSVEEALEPGDEYREVFARVERRLLGETLEAQRAGRQARALLDAVLQTPAGRRAELLGERQEELSEPFAWMLLERAEAAVPRNPQGARDLVELACNVAARLGPRRLPPARQGPMLGQAWAIAGAAAAGEAKWQAAEQAFRDAEEHLESAGLLDGEAAFAALRAWACRKRSSWLEALAWYGRAAELYDRAGDRERRSRMLEAQALLEHGRGEPAAGVGSQALALLAASGGTDRRRTWRARRTLGWMLAVDGRFEEAFEALTRRPAPPGEDAERSATEALSVHALLETGADRERPAEGAAGMALRHAEERGHGFEAALMTLVLAGVFLGTGRVAEQRESLGRRLEAAARSEELGPRASQAMAGLASAVSSGLLTADLLREAARALAEEEDAS